MDQPMHQVEAMATDGERQGGLFPEDADGRAGARQTGSMERKTGRRLAPVISPEGKQPKTPGLRR